MVRFTKHGLSIDGSFLTDASVGEGKIFLRFGEDGDGCVVLTREIVEMAKSVLDLAAKDKR